MGSSRPPVGPANGWQAPTIDPGGGSRQAPPAGPPPAWAAGWPVPPTGAGQPRAPQGSSPTAWTGGWAAPPPGWSPGQAPPGEWRDPTAPPGPPPGLPSTPPPPAPSPAAPPTRDRDGERDRDPWIGGLVLIAIGSLLLVGDRVAGVATLIPLVVGVILLVLFAVRRRYGLLVAGCIVSGVGLGVALASRAGGPDAGALVLLSMAGGFASIWMVARLVALPEPAGWSLIPAAILGSIGALLLAGARDADIGAWWPLVLVGLGVLVIAGRSPGRRPR